jgi:hypothetical protein
MNDDAAGQGPHERPVVPLVERLRDEAHLCRNEGATDIANLLDEAAEEMHNLAWALSLPGFDRMATDEQEAEHQAGVQRVNDMLARMEKAKADHDAAMADAARFRWIDEHALSVDMVADPDNLVQVWRDTLSGHPVTGRTLREAVDEAMRHNVIYAPDLPNNSAC